MRGAPQRDEVLFPSKLAEWETWFVEQRGGHVDDEPSDDGCGGLRRLETRRMEMWRDAGWKFE